MLGFAPEVHGPIVAAILFFILLMLLEPVCELVFHMKGFATSEGSPEKSLAALTVSSLSLQSSPSRTDHKGAAGTIFLPD
ncbi:hypothetical protein NSE_0110 [Neorickettsia sennetsu str. Miyayama]|uniref:Uncharacterized protein n=1 Tax=Ehrlichia sennetsu (strain ATCC VR-367 / Miyayama) TaxID=222891 RepID=Q2GET6_EHRS3|nr:hypothetical protein NSE_0110 [Neorickettsia sennetsu str. Miyayama]